MGSSSKPSKRKAPLEVVVVSSDDEEPPRKPRGAGGPARLPKQELSEDEFDAQMRRATAASMGFGGGSGGTGASGSGSRGEGVKGPGGSRSGQGVGGSAGVGTALEVGKKIKREVSSALASPAAKKIKAEDDAKPLLPSTFSDSSSLSTAKASRRYWKGALLRCSNFYVPDSASFDFGDLLGAPQEHLGAIVSAYDWDFDWLLPHFPKGTPLLLVMQKQGKDDDGPDYALIEAKEKKDRATFRTLADVRRTPGGGQRCMHAKLVVLYFPNFCRIVIPSANATPGGWAELDNAFWIQDFPSHSPSPSLRDPRLNPTHTFYSLPFLNYLAHLRCSKPFLSPFLNYDFSSSTPGVQLVETRQGVWDGFDGINMGGGMCSLAKAVDAAGFSKGGKWEIELSGSSIDAYTPLWLAQFYAACCGIHPRTYFSSKSPTAPGLPSPLPLKFVFPTLDEVIASHGSYVGARNIYCPSKNWTANKACHRLFHKNTSKRPGVIPHTKQIIALRKPDSSSQSCSTFQYEGYVYIGSHNPTRAAWGRLDTGSKGVPTLFNSNYELGVLIPVRADSEDDLERMIGELAGYPRPLTPYASGDVPWMQERYQEEIYGTR